MYIHRSVLLLFGLIYLTFLVGVDWVNAPDASWYRPFLIAAFIILLSAWMQHSQSNDDF